MPSFTRNIFLLWAVCYSAFQMIPFQHDKRRIPALKPEYAFFNIAVSTPILFTVPKLL